MDDIFSQEAWDARYNEKPDAIWSGNPNEALVAEVADLPPGRALDVGCGEGADAVWLAQRGWTVTGTDISPVALARAATHSTEVTWVQADLFRDPPQPRSYDLVTAHFMQLPPGPRKELYGHLAEAVAEGGTLLLVGHHPSHGSHHPTEMFFSAEDLVAELDPEQWDVQVAEERERDQKGMHTIDVVVRAVRAKQH